MGSFTSRGNLALRTSSVDDISPLALGIIGLQISRGFGGRAPMRVTALVALSGANARTHSWSARRGILPSDRSRSRFTFRIPSSEPIRVTRPVAGHDQPHIRSPQTRLHQDPACGGRGSGGRNHSSYRLLRPGPGSVRPPGSARPVGGSGRVVTLFLVETSQACFITAPSMTTPNVTYFHSATSSLRARATIVGFFRRPSLAATRCLNHRDNAESG